MVDGIMLDQMVMFGFEYKNIVLEIEETKSGSGKAIIKGIMLREGVSNNDNVYEVPIMEDLAKQASGAPIYVGTATKFDINTGRIRDNMHSDFEPNRVGTILSALFDPVKRVINYIAEIMNTVNFPHIIEEVKAGWGVSIKGIADAIKTTDASGRRTLMKITNMIFKSLQLLAPHVNLGQDEARVQDVEIQETMIMDNPVYHSKPIQYRLTIETNGNVEITS
jgi:hypothetical protein